MKKLLLLFMVMVLAGCGSKKNALEKAPFVVENLKNLDYETIKASHAEAPVEEGQSMGMEGSEMQTYTTFYPNTKDELTIIWDGEERNKINEIMFSSNGRWTSESGIRIGSTYKELSALNGKPVKFYGFGWDYSGAVDFDGGKLDNQNIHPFFSPGGTVPNEYNRDSIIHASEEEIENLNLSVTKIILNYE